MRLFAYYTLHAFKNQLKKLFKSWILIFILACAVIGGLIGFGAATIADLAQENVPAAVSEPESSSMEQEPEDELVIDIPSMVHTEDKMQIAELVLGGIVLAVLIFEMLSADKNGSRIFLPADVNILFPSPLKPQSVLVFRLMTQLGVALLSSIYLAFQLPNLVLNLGMTLSAGISAILAWILTIVIGRFLQVLLYTLSSTHPRLKSNLRRGLYILIGLILAGYAVYFKTSGGTFFEAACGFFNSGVSRLIPVWGWLKGLPFYMEEGNYLFAAVSFVLLILCAVLLVLIVYRIKADFYEDAMKKSEETAELLEAARSEKSALRRRKKDRSEKLVRDGMTRGEGASVFFWKAIYNRFRFAHLRIFTKTSETYLAAAILMALACRFIFKTQSFIPTALLLAAISFFRSLGNPLEQDVRMDHFLLIPESTWSKIFYSLLGGCACCAMDLIPGVLAGTLILFANPATSFLWILFIVTIDFYSTSVGTFIGVSTPASAGKTLKQMIQIFFIYFGLLPDIALIAVGLAMNLFLPMVLIAAVLNLGLGFLFSAFSPRFIDPRPGPARERASTFGDPKEAKQHYSRIGFGLFAVVILTVILEYALMMILNAAAPGFSRSPLYTWVIGFLPMYLVAIPAGVVLMKKPLPPPILKRRFGAGRYFRAILIAFFLMYAGNLIGVFVNLLIGRIAGKEIVNPIETILSGDSVILRALFVALIGPVIEELLFRKVLIDRMHVFGGKSAVVMSALLFGLLHGNLSQFFYAFGLGLLFGYLYLMSGKLRYSVALHILINTLGGVVAPEILRHIDLSALQNPMAFNPDTISSLLNIWTLLYLVYASLLFSAAIAGLILLIVRRRHIRFEAESRELRRGERLRPAVFNLGMLLFFIASLGMFIRTLLL